MRIFSEKVNYAILAMLKLAKNYSKQLHIGDIAKSQNIPKNYLEKLLIILKKDRLVESTRGVNGGYKLRKPAKKIRIIDIITALEGDIKLISSSNNSKVLKSFWNEKEEQVKILFQDTLEDLILKETKLNNQLTYQI
jgi:Rrf2 family protein